SVWRENLEGGLDYQFSVDAVTAEAGVVALAQPIPIAARPTLNWSMTWSKVGQCAGTAAKLA
ncbi:hypothetical protein, partial [Acetobacter syzygii]|uniref:hypothetical protein n=1 Tax=Acetobacter syzygii TaxID=146476 RepID=UPI0039ECA411